MDAFSATRLAIGAVVLAFAAASDLRTRRVRDPLWIVLGTVGFALLGTQITLAGSPWPAWSFLGSASIVFYAVFFGEPLFGEAGFHARPIRIAMFFVATALFFVPLGAATTTDSTPSSAELASMPVMVVVYQAFYRLRLVHGGADAKGLIALTVFVPTYPDLVPFPILAADPRVESILHIAFPFSLVVWVDAAIASLAVPIGLFAYNAIRGDVGMPQAFLGYRTRLDPFPRHAWLMERITDRGEHVLVLFPKRGVDPRSDIEKLHAAGIDRAWVTPQIPFMVPLLIGFLLAFLVGNVLLGIAGLAR